MTFASRICSKVYDYIVFLISLVVIPFGTSCSLCNKVGDVVNCLDCEREKYTSMYQEVCVG